MLRAPIMSDFCECMDNPTPLSYPAAVNTGQLEQAVHRQIPFRLKLDGQDD